MSDKIKVSLTPGPVVRVIGDIEWSAAAGWTQAVPLELAADLLAYPRPGWSLAEPPTAAQRKKLADLLGVAPENIVAPGEPVLSSRPPSLAEVVGSPARAGELAEFGVTVRGLKALDESGIRDLAYRSGATPAEIGEWIERAK